MILFRYEQLQSFEGIDFSGVVLDESSIIEWVVRLLTPLECERLQGYPDGWTILQPLEDMTDEEYEFFLWVWKQNKEIKGQKYKNVPNKQKLIRWHNKLCVDSARYEALGNSLAIPCALRVIGYIADYVRENEKSKLDNGERK